MTDSSLPSREPDFVKGRVSTQWEGEGEQNKMSSLDKKKLSRPQEDVEGKKERESEPRITIKQGLASQGPHLKRGEGASSLWELHPGPGPKKAPGRRKLAA